MKRIGLMGGSFNPIHNRHLAIAACAKQELQLDTVLFIPTGNPPHKRDGMAGAQDRYEMTRLAILPYDSFSISDIETARAGITYSVDTLRLLKTQYPDATFAFIIGEDTLHDLPHWHDPDIVFTLCSFAVCCRSSQTVQDSPIVRELEARGARFSYLSLPPAEVSSTAIRKRLAQTALCDDLPPQVMTYIRIAGLYGHKGLPNGREMLERLKNALRPPRYLHSLRVAYTAVELAMLHNIPQAEAELAGLLHDCAKHLPLEEMQQIAIRSRLQLDADILQKNSLLHGPVGAVVAKESYGVTNEQVLAAIACHTTGKVDMTPLDMLLFLADKTEPGRKSYPLLEQIRALSRTDLTKATLLSVESSRDYVLSKGASLYKDSDSIIHWLKSRVS